MYEYKGARHPGNAANAQLQSFEIAMALPVAL
jgi:hypothetical protein